MSNKNYLLPKKSFIFQRIKPILFSVIIFWALLDVTTFSENPALLKQSQFTIIQHANAATTPSKSYQQPTKQNSTSTASLAKSQSSLMDFVGNFIFLFIVVGIIFYFIPTLIAGTRNHKFANYIFAINIFFGWTVLGWVAVLMWAVNNDIQRGSGENK